MGNLVYHVATTLDGFIANKNHDINGFLVDTEHLADFQKSLKNDYSCVLMGKNTYEFGFKFGLKQGEPAYTEYNLPNYVVASDLDYKPEYGLTVISEDVVGEVKKLKQNSKKDVWLCGGGQLAGFLLEKKLIDKIIVKQNPTIFGEGIKLFEGCHSTYQLDLEDYKSYKNSICLLTYRVNYEKQVPDAMPS